MIAGMAMLASSCTEQETAGLEGYGTRTVTFSATAGGQTQTRAGGAAPAVDGHTLKYYLQVLNGSGEKVGEVQTSTDGSFTVKLPTGSGTYDCLFWADYVPTSGGATENAYFTTTDLRAVTLKQRLEDSDKCQAFCAALNIDAGTVDANHAVTLTRAVAQVNLRNSAAMDDFNKVVATYTNVPNKFNVLTGATEIVAGGVADHSFEVTDFTGVGGSNNYTFQSAYFLAPGTEDSHMLKIKLETYSSANPTTPLQTLNLDNVPTKKNYKTNVTGAFQSATTVHTYSFAFANWDDDEYYRPMSVWNGNAATPNHSSTFSGGEGTEANPYIIGSAADLAQLAANANDDINPNSYEDTYFKLAIDIDLNGKQWTPIMHFYGHLDGKQHEIKNMKIESDEGGDLGLFKRLAWGEVSNLHVSGDITSTNGGNIGGICGSTSNGTSIANCSFKGSITGGDNAGGIVGDTEINMIITCSRNSGTISGKNAGGIVGSLFEGVAAGCYNSGVVKTTEDNGYAGGIVGLLEDNIYSRGSVIGCYNIGEVQGVSGTTAIGAISGKSSSISQSCYVKGTYSVTLGSGETKFGSGTGAWPDGSSVGTPWYADTNNDGTFTYNDSGDYNYTFTDCKFWKSVGAWGYPSKYPKLWWEE